eukprot:4164774-Amphidinium_carterae.1
MLHDVLALPAHNRNRGMCWRCTCRPDQVSMVGPDAPWRHATQRLDHADLLLDLHRLGTVVPVWGLPGFTSRMIKIDWLHCVDLGIASYLFGA